MLRSSSVQKRSDSLFNRHPTTLLPESKRILAFDEAHDLPIGLCPSCIHKQGCRYRLGRKMVLLCDEAE
jgi:hypothetical protein